MSKEAMQDAAKALLKTCESVSLASINEDGFPRICEMEKVRADGLEHLYFATLKTSHKVRHYLRCAKAGVGFCVGDDSVSLIGHVEVLEGEEDKQRILPPAYLERLRKKDSTRYCILHFTTVAAKLFINGEFYICNQERT